MADTQEIPSVPQQTPGQDQIFLPSIANPYASVWWTTQSVSDVPESIMGWLVAQGYEVVGIRQDNTTVPPTNYFNLRRQGMQPWQVLLSLCNSYTIAANEARIANQGRYNQIVANWTEMVNSSHQHFASQISEQNVQAGIFLTDLDEYMNAIDALIEDNKSQIVQDAEAANTALGEMNARLGDLETNAQDSIIDIEVLFGEQETLVNTFVNQLNSKLAEIDANYTAHLGAVLSQISGLEVVLGSHIADYNAQFTILANNYSAHESEINGMLDVVTNNVNDYVGKVDEILDLIDADYTSISGDLDQFSVRAGDLVTDFARDFMAVLNLLSSDFSTHSTAASGFLTDLGSEELARINEEAAANLALQVQDLMDRGMYVSAVITDITARNHRDRDDKIQALNDRLNREKWENQHRTYEQRVIMRSRTLDGIDKVHGVEQEVLRYQASLVVNTNALLQETRSRILAGHQAVFAAKDGNSKFGIDIKSALYAKLQDVRQRVIASLERIYQLQDAIAKWENSETSRLYEQLQSIEQQYLASYEKQHTENQEVSRTEMNQRNTFLTQIQEALRALLSGKERYSTILMQNASTLAEHRHKAISERMESSIKRLEGWKNVADENRKLMAYQLDERNKLLIGLYSFVERRDDIGPEWKDMASMIAGLGDSAGGWIQP